MPPDERQQRAAEGVAAAATQLQRAGYPSLARDLEAAAQRLGRWAGNRALFRCAAAAVFAAVGGVLLRLPVPPTPSSPPRLPTPQPAQVRAAGIAD